jgi:hypothetical protein
MSREEIAETLEVDHDRVGNRRSGWRFRLGLLRNRARRYCT